jgi:hypothetical protein
MVQLPTVTLDTTLADLYRRASPKNAAKRIGQVLCGTNSGVSLNDNFPRNLKYLYQDSPFNNVPKDELTEDNKELRRSLAMKYLSLVPQRDAFISGDTAVVMFNVSQEKAQITHDMCEAEKTIEALDPKQRPQLIFCPGPAEIPFKENSIDMLACKVVLDPLEAYPSPVDLETHWFLNSKAALARSGLPTPSCKIIELDGYSIAANHCCEHCRTGDIYYIPPECVGSRGQWVEAQGRRVVDEISQHPVPFVVKNQQTFGGAGTYVVNSEGDRKSLVSEFSDGLLRKLFSQVTERNQHLKPGTVLLSEMVKDPVGDYGITMFVTDSGDAIFLAASEQMIDDNHAWIGSTINYPHQKQLEEKFSSVSKSIARWLHQHGYFGPAGADILETRNQGNPGEPGVGSSEFHIVDLNVRTSGSLCLPLLRSHYESRGMHSASSFSITVKASRDEFVEKWQKDFESGRMCILSWYEDQQAGHSIADVAVGGEDEQRLRAEIERVRATTDEVTF